jgi:CelD/BcsL family acetyltransferase involved in cellulose biosynthesis
VLARLSAAGQPVAVLYGFVTGSKFDFYQSGVRTDAPGLRSPGNQAHLLLMRALAGRGVGWYDFLRGASSYKERLATGANRLVGVEVWRPTLRAAVYRSARFVRRSARAALQRLRRPAPPADEAP